MTDILRTESSPHTYAHELVPNIDPSEVCGIYR